MRLPRNVWAASLTSFLTDISSEMVLNLVPLFLANVLHTQTGIIGLIEGVAEATASVLKVFSGWLSDRLRARKWLAVGGYGLSAASKPFFLIAGSWGVVAAVRWADRVGKGVRTAPRDALVADSVEAPRRGMAFGFQRAADTAGAALGILIALGVVWATQAGGRTLAAPTFRTLVWISLLPAVLAVVVLAIGARERRPAAAATSAASRWPLANPAALGRPFLVYLAITGLFDLGNSSDAFLVLRAQERGLSVAGILAMLFTFNVVYSVVALPAGKLSDRLGRRGLIAGGWLVYAAIYLGFALARTGWHVWLLYVAYGLYYGLAAGASRALVADLVPAALRGTAFGTYNALLGVLDLPASLIAGVLWQGIGGWRGFGAPAPFAFGAAMALLAAALLAAWKPTPAGARQPATEAP